MTYNVFGGTLNLAQSINQSTFSPSHTLMITYNYRTTLYGDVMERTLPSQEFHVHLTLRIGSFGPSVPARPPVPVPVPIVGEVYDI